MSSRHRHPVGDLARVRTRPGHGRTATPPAGRTPLLLRATVGGAAVLAVAASVIRTSGAEPTSESAAVASRSISPVAQNLTSDDAGRTTRGAARPARSRQHAAGVSCRVRYTVSSHSAGQFTAVLTVVNTGRTNVTGWTLRWQDPTGPRIVNSWNSTVVAGSGGVRARDSGMNRVIAAGDSTTIGFVGTGDGASPDRSNFALNGVMCR